MLICPQCDNVLSKAEEENHYRCAQCGFYLNVALIKVLRKTKEEKLIDVDRLRKAGL
jgi:protein-arginine kinase activator protein McsA